MYRQRVSVYRLFTLLNLQIGCHHKFMEKERHRLRPCHKFLNPSLFNVLHAYDSYDIVQIRHFVKVKVISNWPSSLLLLCLASHLIAFVAHLPFFPWREMLQRGSRCQETVASATFCVYTRFKKVFCQSMLKQCRNFMLMVFTFSAGKPPQHL